MVIKFWMKEFLDLWYSTDKLESSYLFKIIQIHHIHTRFFNIGLTTNSWLIMDH